MAETPIPNRADTLKVLALMGKHAPILMLRGDDDGFGTRWTLHGAQVQPAIAQFLMQEKHVVDSGTTEMGARILALTESGAEFRQSGQNWWDSLSFLQRLQVRIFG
jgi:hypothetical protein